MRSDCGRWSHRRRRHASARRGRGPRRVLVVAAAVVGALTLTAGPALASPAAPASAAAPAATAGPAATKAAATTDRTAAAGATTTAAAARPTLRQGSRGSAVTSLQRRLTALHYDLGTVDGVFGTETFHAVVAFQKVNNLGRDGIVGPATWARLDRPLAPHARYSHSGTWIEVRLDKQFLMLVRNGSVIRILDVSSGKPSTPTVTGNFTIQRRIDGWRTSDLGRLWRPNYFYQGYAIHGYPSVPNYPASHGCVRVSMAAMNRLWGVIGVGMPTHVYYR
jgi:N-acetylmuramoyl-L-alanine amidase